MEKLTSGRKNEEEPPAGNPAETVRHHVKWPKQRIPEGHVEILERTRLRASILVLLLLALAVPPIAAYEMGAPIWVVVTILMFVGILEAIIYLRLGDQNKSPRT